MSVLDPELNVGFLIHDVSRMMRNWFDARAQHLGLTRAQWRVLIQLSAREGASQRRPDPDDRRVWRLHLTPAARPTLDEMEALAIQLQEDAVAGLSQDERAALNAALKRIKANVIAASAAEMSEELDAG